MSIIINGEKYTTLEDILEKLSTEEREQIEKETKKLLKSVDEREKKQMKRTYAIKITLPEKDEKSYLVYIPAWDIYTQGETVEECIYMAKDAVGLMGIDYEDDNKPIPQSSVVKLDCAQNEISAFIDVDFAAYRAKYEKQTADKVEDNQKESFTPAELAEMAGVSVATVYNRARKLGRLPTVEELKQHKPSGRPKKYY